MRKIILLSVLNIFLFVAKAQVIEIDFKEKPLNEALVEIRDKYNLYFSFNNDVLSKYSITLKGNYISIEKFLDEALQELPLKYKRNGMMIIIVKKEIKEEPKEFTISGQIVDINSNESLPFSHVLINDHGLVCDMNGYFTFISKKDSVFKVKVSYLGYYILDTTMNEGQNIKIGLTPSRVGLKEITIEGKNIEYKTQIGENAGELKLNHKVAKFLPGYGDNSVYNLLRLQPGILASGEQSNSLLIWGSYDGQNQILFDGFTIFGLKNFNDMIGSVNPFMVKDIQVKKAGYGSEYGERAGGIVNINGVDGNTNKPTFNLLLNNLTMNAMASIPVLKRSAITGAFRQTYYNLYDAEDINLLKTERANSRREENINIYPDYSFMDYNIKMAGKIFRKDNYAINFFTGKDNFSYELDYQLIINRIEQSTKEVNSQNGASFVYHRRWKTGLSTNLTLSHSSLEKEFERYTERIRIRTNRQTFYSQRYVANNVFVQNINIDNSHINQGHHQINYGAGAKLNKLELVQEIKDQNIDNENNDAVNYYFYAEDRITLFKKGEMKIGSRINYPDNISKLYIQPRTSFKYKISNNIKAGLAWGIYNQFIIKSIDVDSLGNINYLWNITDDNKIPVQNAQHYVGSINYENDGLELSLEGYFKNTDGITKIIRSNGDVVSNIVSGTSKSKGIDFYVSKDFGNHSAWISYSLGQTMEYYNYAQRDYNLRAAHDQTHELKAAALFSISPFYFSANYVYGSGFPDPSPTRDLNTSEDIPYNRCDVSVVYRFNTSQIKFETGLSILNLFNSYNIKYDNLLRVPNETGSININAEAIPFTPSLFLNIGF